MALSESKVMKVKVDFEAGLLTKTNIASKHKINRLTLYKLAERHGWEYGKNKQEINKITEQKSLENVIQKQVDNATEVTNQFLTDIKNHRSSILTVSAAYAKKVKESNNQVTKEDADRLFASAKVNKIVAESLNICYMGARKALGMDKEGEEGDKRASGVLFLPAPGGDVNEWAKQLQKQQLDLIAKEKESK